MTDRDGRAWSAAGALLGAIVAFSVACGETPEPPPARTVSDSSSVSGEVTMPVPADTIELGPRMRARGMSFRAPAAWTHLPASSPIRIAQFIIPPGDVSNYGELVVFHFGPGEGGSAQENVKEWTRGFEAPEGKTWKDMAEVDRFTSGELTITTLRVVGTMLPSRMSGPDGPLRRPDWQMLAAIVEGPGGPWFFKATGPRASMARAEHRFGRMLRTLRVERMP